ncbi:unnamed protein product [Diamesa hyperborea]
MHLKVFVLVCLSSLAFASETEENVEKPDVTIILTDENFAETIKTNNFFVNFYVPWCVYCVRLAPTWKQLAEVLNRDEESRVRIAKVDCTVSRKTCSDNEVNGYPTLKLFRMYYHVKYSNARDLPSLTQFINDKLGSPLPSNFPVNRACFIIPLQKR